MVLEGKINWAIKSHFVKIQLNYKKWFWKEKLIGQSDHISAIDSSYILFKMKKPLNFSWSIYSTKIQWFLHFSWIHGATKTRNYKKNTK
jgi:hypothetical protein